MLINYFYIILLLVISQGCEDIWKFNNQSIIREYEDYSSHIQDTMKVHDELIKYVNIYIEEYRYTRKREALINAIDRERTYIDRKDVWLSELYNLKNFIEANEKVLRMAGINPDYKRDNLKNSIQLIRDNTKLFHENIIKQEIALSYLPKAKKLKK